MRTKAEVMEIMSEYVPKVKALYGDKLNKIVLYGSYARGDYHEDSDVDVMILLDVAKEALGSTRNAVIDMTYDFNYQKSIDIMPVIQCKSLFHYWEKVLPFYRNVNSEGIVLYG